MSVRSALRAAFGVPRSVLYKRGAERGTDAPRRVYTYDFTVRIAEHLTRRGARNGRTCSNGTENNSSVYVKYEGRARH